MNAKTKTAEKNQVTVINTESTVIATVPEMPESQMMPVIEKIMALDNFDVDRFEKLLMLKREEDDRFAKQAFFAALSTFQSQIPTITKSKTASFQHNDGIGKTEYSYASIDDIDKAIKPFLSSNGLTYHFEQIQENGLVDVTCVVSHALGHSQRCSMTSTPDNSGRKNAIQQIASTITYLRRYTLTGALGICTADNDDDAMSSEAIQQDAPQQEAAAATYPVDSFKKNFPSWKKAISEGRKSHDEIIMRAEAKAPLTQTQKSQIMSIQQKSQS